MGERPLLRGALTALITGLVTWPVFFYASHIRTVDWGTLLMITIFAIAIAVATWNRLDYHDPSL